MRRADPAAVFERWERHETAKEAQRWAALPVFREVCWFIMVGQSVVSCEEVRAATVEMLYLASAWAHIVLARIFYLSALCLCH